MDIRKKEDELFEKWMRKDKFRCFIKDGCPAPEVYSKSEMKIVFVLKDANFGEERINSNSEPHEQRDPMRNKPHPWWEKLRDWCVPIMNPEMDWEQRINISIKESLAPFAFMQLKKSAGEGSVNNETLTDFAIRYNEKIRSQFEIYQPDFIVCCGVGKIVNTEVFSGTSERKVTPNGIGYWTIKVDGAPDEKVTYIIDFCHPSARFGGKIAGTVAFGLAQAINYLNN